MLFPQLCVCKCARLTAWYCIEPVIAWLKTWGRRHVQLEATSTQENGNTRTDKRGTIKLQSDNEKLQDNINILH